MGRSQRHLLEQRNKTSAGETVAQGVVAPTLLHQVLQPTPMKPTASPMLGQTIAPGINAFVPHGSGGGPLSGSSLSGAIPEALLAVAAAAQPVAAPMRTFPIGPVDIAKVSDSNDGLEVFFLDQAFDVMTGDTVDIRATGDTSVNGTYTVLRRDITSVVVDNTYTPPNEIIGKGRLTVIAGA